MVLSITGCSRELPPEQHNNFHRYGVEHATLHYEYFGDTRGTEDLYFDGFGLREAHAIHSELITDKGFVAAHSYSVRIVGKVTTVDTIMQQESIRIDPVLDSLFRISSNDYPAPEMQFRQISQAIGYHLVGDTTLFGLKFHIWQKLGRLDYLYEWKGILMGSKDQVGDHGHELRLLSIDTTQPIDPARFSEPTGSGFPIADYTSLKPRQELPPAGP